MALGMSGVRLQPIRVKKGAIRVVEGVGVIELIIYSL